MKTGVRENKIGKKKKRKSKPGNFSTFSLSFPPRLVTH